MQWGKTFNTWGTRSGASSWDGRWAVARRGVTRQAALRWVTVYAGGFARARAESLPAGPGLRPAVQTTERMPRPVGPRHPRRPDYEVTATAPRWRRWSA